MCSGSPRQIILPKDLVSSGSLGTRRANRENVGRGTGEPGKGKKLAQSSLAMAHRSPVPPAIQLPTAGLGEPQLQLPTHNRLASSIVIPILPMLKIPNIVHTIQSYLTLGCCYYKCVLQMQTAGYLLENGEQALSKESGIATLVIEARTCNTISYWHNALTIDN